MKCKYCGESLSNNDHATRHAGECLVMNCDYSQFYDPERAASNLPSLVKFYKDHPEIKEPNQEIDHIAYAWRITHDSV